MTMTTSETSPSVGRTGRKDPLRKVVIAAAAGNALEWFDFSSYAFFATYISANFFARGNRLRCASARDAALRSGYARLASSCTGGFARVYFAPVPATCAA